MEVEIGLGKKARQAYGFDDIAIVPTRRTRDPDDVDIGWKLGDHLLELPLLASAMDGVVSPRTAIEIGKLGGLGVLNLEGIFTRYAKADEQLERIAKFSAAEATRGMQKIYAKAVDPELIGASRPRDQGRRRARRLRAHAAAGRGVLPDRPRGRARRPRHPGHRRLGRARVGERRLAQPEGVHREPRHPGGRRRLRLLPRRAPPDAHRRGRRARRRRPWRSVHDARRARGRRSPGDGDRGRRGGARPAHPRLDALRERDRGRRHAHRRRHLEGGRVRRRRGHDRLAARPRLRRARPRLPLGHGDVPSHASSWRPREGRADRAAQRDPRRSCDARTTGRST